MKFAAGLTVSGVIGFIVLEALKMVMPAVTVWVIGILTILLKIILIGIVIFVVLSLLGIGFFFYKRSQRAEMEA